jgi:hypothetical protein
MYSENALRTERRIRIHRMRLFLGPAAQTVCFEVRYNDIQ